MPGYIIAIIGSIYALWTFERLDHTSLPNTDCRSHARLVLLSARLLRRLSPLQLMGSGSQRGVDRARMTAFYLKPHQIVERREKADVTYIGIRILASDMDFERAFNSYFGGEL